MLAVSPHLSHNLLKSIVIEAESWKDFGPFFFSPASPPYDTNQLFRKPSTRSLNTVRKTRSNIVTARYCRMGDVV